MVVDAGLTTGEAPDVEYAPPHEPVYHFQIAPSVLRLPPVILKVVDAPTHIVDGDEPAEVAATDNGCTVTVVFTHDVVLHKPSART